MSLARKLFGTVAAVGLALGLAGCPNGDISLDVASATGTITGKLINGATRAAIGDQEVILIVNGQKRTTRTNNSSTDNDLKGNFSFSGVPAGDHTLKVAATGFAVLKTTVTVGQSQDNTPITKNLGLVALAEGVDLTVMVTASGSPVEGIVVFAEPVSIANECRKITTGVNEALFDVSDSTHEILATTGADGTAVLSGANKCGTYAIVAAAQGIYNTAATFFDAAINSDTTTALALSPQEATDLIDVADASLFATPYAFQRHTITDTAADPGTDATVDTISSGDDVTTSTGNIMVVFKRPVTIVSAPQVTYEHMMTNPDANGDDAVDAAYGDTVDLGVTGTLDSFGVVLTIPQPTGGWPTNEVLHLGGLLGASVDSTQDVYDLFGDIYVTDSGTTGLSSTTTVTADNYNGVATGGTGTVYLEFPEYVNGSLRVISTTDTASSTTTLVNGSEQTITGGVLVYTDGTTNPACNACGTGAGTFFLVSTGYTLSDGDKIKVAYDVTDAEGNNLVGTDVELTVQ